MEDQKLRIILEKAKTISVVGLSPDPQRDSHEVAEYLQRSGYKIIPVNPKAETILGEKSYPDIASIPEPVDIVDIFRRPEHVPAIVEEAIAARAGTVWMQLGIVHEEAAKKASEAGLHVVMDRCILQEHKRLLR